MKHTNNYVIWTQVTDEWLNSLMIIILMYLKSIKLLSEYKKKDLKIKETTEKKYSLQLSTRLKRILKIVWWKNQKKCQVRWPEKNPENRVKRI